MTPTDIAEWRRLAEAATEGPWEPIQTEGGRETYVYSPTARYGVPWAGDSPVKVAWIPWSPSTERDANDAAYIAHASPDRVLALLGECERLRNLFDAIDSTLAQPGLKTYEVLEIVGALAARALKGPDHE